MVGGTRAGDPLASLREYRHLAPWSLRDLAALTAGILDACGIRPINAAASLHPTERTIRFYVTRNLVTAPEGRGTAAVYSYRHLLEVLAVKLRQMEGATLATITTELTAVTGDVLERRIAAALGPRLPLPASLPIFGKGEQPRGRAGHVLGTWAAASDETSARSDTSTWRRVPVTEGVELHVRDDHALADRDDLRDQAAEAVRLALGRVLSAGRGGSSPPGRFGLS
jgi:DNA-binding transcriptional MerR regulator